MQRERAYVAMPMDPCPEIKAIELSRQRSTLATPESETLRSGIRFAGQRSLAWRTSRSTPCTGNEICTGAAGNSRSAGFVRDFISVVPFFAC